MEIIRGKGNIELSNQIENSDSATDLDQLLKDIQSAFATNKINENEYAWLLKKLYRKCHRLGKGGLVITEQVELSLQLLNIDDSRGFIPNPIDMYHYIERHFFALVMLIMLVSLTMAFIGKSFPETPIQKIGLVGIIFSVLVIFSGIIISIASIKKNDTEIK